MVIFSFRFFQDGLCFVHPKSIIIEIVVNVEIWNSKWSLILMNADIILDTKFYHKWRCYNTYRMAASIVLTISQEKQKQLEKWRRSGQTTSSSRSTRVPQNYHPMQTRMGDLTFIFAKELLVVYCLNLPHLEGFCFGLGSGKPHNSRQPRWQAQQIARAFCATPAVHVSQPWPWNAPSVSLQGQEPQLHATLHQRWKMMILITWHTDWLKDDEGVKCNVFLTCLWHFMLFSMYFQCISRTS